MTQRHNVFVSYHHANDETHKLEFERLFGGVFDILVTRSVQDGDIDLNIKTETIRRKIRDEYLRNSTVTVVLIGRETWKRKHVDWEIGSSLRHTEFNSRSGLLGILLPTFQKGWDGKYDPHMIPPRLWDNIQNDYATMHDWTSNAGTVQQWIHNAFVRRTRSQPDNSRPQFGRNWTGDRWQ